MQSFYQRFVDTATRHPDNIAVELQRSRSASDSSAADSSSDIDVRYTYAELRRIAEHVGAWLQSQGIPAGARCAILAANSPRWVAAYLAVMAAGGVAVPLDTAFKAEQVAKLLKDCSASMLFVDAAHLEVGKAAWAVQNSNSADPGGLFVLDSSAESALPSLDQVLSSSVPQLTPSQASSDDIAVLLYTSGTTS